MLKKIISLILVILMLNFNFSPSLGYAKRIDYKKNPSGFDIAATLLGAYMVASSRSPSQFTINNFLRQYLIPRVSGELGKKLFGKRHGYMLGSMLGEYIGARYLDFRDMERVIEEEADRLAEEATQEMAEEAIREVTQREVDQIAKEAAEEVAKNIIQEGAPQELAAKAARKAAENAKGLGKEAARKAARKAALRVFNTTRLIKKAALVRAFSLGTAMLSGMLLGDSALSALGQMVVTRWVHYSLLGKYQIVLVLGRKADGSTYQAVVDKDISKVKPIKKEVREPPVDMEKVKEEFGTTHGGGPEMPGYSGPPQNKIIGYEVRDGLRVKVEDIETIEAEGMTPEFKKILRKRLGAALIETIGDNSGLSYFFSSALTSGDWLSAGLSIGLTALLRKAFPEDRSYVGPLDRELFALGLSSIAKALMRGENPSLVMGRDLERVMSDVFSWGMGEIDYAGDVLNKGNIIWLRPYNPEYTLRLADALEQTREQNIPLGLRVVGASADIIGNFLNYEIASSAHYLAVRNFTDIIRGNILREDYRIVKPQEARKNLEEARATINRILSEIDWEEVKRYYEGELNSLQQEPEEVPKKSEKARRKAEERIKEVQERLRRIQERVKRAMDYLCSQGRIEEATLLGLAYDRFQRAREEYRAARRSRMFGPTARHIKRLDVSDYSSPDEYNEAFRERHPELTDIYAFYEITPYDASIQRKAEGVISELYSPSDRIIKVRGRLYKLKPGTTFTTPLGEEITITRVGADGRIDWQAEKEGKVSGGASNVTLRDLTGSRIGAEIIPYSQLIEEFSPTSTPTSPSEVIPQSFHSPVYKIDPSLMMAKQEYFLRQSEKTRRLFEANARFAQKAWNDLGKRAREGAAVLRPPAPEETLQRSE